MFKRIAAVCILLTAFFIGSLQAAAIDTGASETYYTYAPSIEGDYLRSRDGYLPSEVLLLNSNLNNPEDICCYKNNLYIADTGNSRILDYSLDDRTSTEIGTNLLTAPTGVSVDSQGRIYVADSDSNKAYRFSASGDLEQTFSRPEEPSFGKDAPFIPLKIAAGDEGGVYIVGEGAYSGIIQMDGEGQFLGYFATNSIKMSFLDRVKELIYTKKQKQSQLKKLPPSFSNLARGTDGLLYTITDGDNTRIKKHSISGLNMLPDGLGSNWENIIDIAVSGQGVFYTVDKNGFIEEFTSDGMKIQYFGAPAQTSDRVGLISEPSGIAVDDNNRIYVLDKARGCVQSYLPCQITTDIFSAIQSYNSGRYAESRQTWQSVLDQNNMSSLAHVGIAKAFMQEQKYDEAELHYKIAGDKEGYSDAFWEIRNRFLTENATAIFFVIVLLAAGLYIFRLIKKKRRSRYPDKALVKQNDIRFFSDLRSLKSSLTHPMDTCYEIKYKSIGTCISATVLYFTAFLLYLLFRTESGFLFSASSLQNYPVFLDFIIYVCIVALWNSGNYLISSINDGEGKFRTVYIANSYMIAPFLIFMPFIIIISNFLTNTESFLITMCLTVLIVWCMLRLFSAVIEVHNYTYGAAIKNVLLTLFFMVTVTLALSVVYLLISRMLSFIAALAKEVILRG